MKPQLLLFLLLVILALAACGGETPVVEQPQAATATAAAPTIAATATALPAPTAKPEPTAAPSPTAEPEPTDVPEPTVTPNAAPDGEPEAPADPFALARQLLEQAELPEAEGWTVAPCEGEAPSLCVGDGEQNLGYAELLVFPLAGYDPTHPLRAAAEALPADAAGYTAADEETAREALAALAAEHLDVIREDRAITYPDDTFTPLDVAPARLGALPAVTFGFVHTDAAGEVVERYLYVVAFDRDVIYWLGINYDPANVSTFVSDEALTAFAPLFREIAAALPVG